MDLALDLEAERRHQQRVLPRLPGASFIEEAGIGHDDPVRRHLGGADLVGHVRDDLEADPEAGVARELEAEPAEVEDLLHAARIEHREERVVERHLGVRRDRRRLRERIVAAQRQHAAVAPDAGEVRVLEDVAGAIDARALAVPHAEHAVVLRLREQVGELAAVDRRRAEVLVDAGDEDDVVLAEQIRVALEGEIEPAERRAAIAGDERGGVEPAALVGAVLVQGQTHQRLNAREEDETFLLTVLGVQSEITLDRHGSPLEVTARMIRGATGEAQIGREVRAR